MTFNTSCLEEVLMNHVVVVKGGEMFRVCSALPDSFPISVFELTL